MHAAFNHNHVALVSENIVFLCPGCEIQLEIAAEVLASAAGGEMACPECGAVFTLPALPDDGEPVAETAPEIPLTTQPPEVPPQPVCCNCDKPLSRGDILCIECGTNQKTGQSIAPPDIPSASSLFNLMRKLGGAVGVAMLATVIDSHTTLHFSHINETVSLISDQTQQHLASIGQTLIQQGIAPLEAERNALNLVANLMRREAKIMAFSDTMFLIGAGLGFACLLILPTTNPSKPAKNIKPEISKKQQGKDYLPTET